MYARSKFRSLISALLLAPALVGCREDQGGTSYEGDLGRDGTVLLPTGSAWVSADLAKGQAEWPPFRKPDDAPPEEPAAKGDTAASAGELEKEIREFIDGYNGVAATAPAEELLDYFVEDQREALKPVLTSAAALAAADAALLTELEAKLADAPERVQAAAKGLHASAPYLVSAQRLADVTENGASAELAPGSLFATCSFVRIDQDWYLKAPDGEALGQSQRALDAAQTARKGWLAALQAETPDIDSVLKEIEEWASGAKASAKPEGETKTEDAPAPEARAALAEDSVKVAPNNYKVVFENDSVRVSDVQLKPGETIGTHSHPDHLVYQTDAGKLRLSYPDGKSKELGLKAGEVTWIKGETHTVENVGTTETNAVVFELKKPASSDRPPKMSDVDDQAKLSPQTTKVLLDNDRVRVLDVRYKPGAKIPMHRHPAAHLVYHLGDGEIGVSYPPGPTLQLTFIRESIKTGDVGWMEAVSYALENFGTAEAHHLVIEFKEQMTSK